MTRLILILALAASACAKVTPETPKAATAIKADEVLLRVKELQSAVLAACWPDGVMAPACVPGGISTPAMREFVKATIDVAQVSKAVPVGWQATVKASWLRAKPRILALGPFPSAVQIALGVVDTLIGSLL